MTPRKRSPSLVREPIQVYLTPGDRRLLDQIADSTGLSRAEVLRRGIRTMASKIAGQRSPMLELMDRLSKEDWPDGLAGSHDDHLAQDYLDPHSRAPGK